MIFQVFYGHFEAPAFLFDKKALNKVVWVTVEKGPCPFFLLTLSSELFCSSQLNKLLLYFFLQGSKSPPLSVSWALLLFPQLSGAFLLSLSLVLYPKLLGPIAVDDASQVP